MKYYKKMKNKFQLQMNEVINLVASLIMNQAQTKSSR